MQTRLPEALLETPDGARANEIIRSCVHCGFCNATCPTYQVTGNELEGPRGRIFLIRDLLEGEGDETRVTRHLDSCLTCRACETTCPSGVAYGELAEIARNRLGAERSGLDGAIRRWLRWVVPNPGRLRIFATLGRWVRFALPSRLRKQLPARVGGGVRTVPSERRSVVLLNGCAQRVSTPRTNEVLQEILSRNGIGTTVVDDEGCCGALDLHLGAEEAALERVRANVDRLFPLLETADAVVSSASGCGVTYRDYGRLLAHDVDYAERATAVAEAVEDVSAYLSRGELNLSRALDAERVAFHAPCTLNHGLKSASLPETLLRRVGYELLTVEDAHLCCGSAGTYSILNPEMATELQRRKISALGRERPDVIATANVGCQTHLASGTETQVVHWIELLK